MFYIPLDQVLKEHIESLPAKRKKAHRRASRHALHLKSKRRPLGAVQSQSSSGGGIQAGGASGGVGEDGGTGVAGGVAMTGPAAAGLSRASVSSTRTLRSFDIGSNDDSGRWSPNYNVMYFLYVCVVQAVISIQFLYMCINMILTM